MTFPVQTAEWDHRAVGALVLEICTQVFVAGLYLNPVFVGVRWTLPL
jgi:hypothetical protein